LHAARVSLGAGHYCRITLQCVDNYDLEFRAYWCRVEDIIDKIDTLNQENERVRLWYFPSTMFGISCDRSHDEPRRHAPGVLGQFQQGAPAAFGNLTDPLTSVSSSIRSAGSLDPNCPVWVSRFTGNYVNVLTLPAFLILHRECEYAPVENTRCAPAIKQVEEGNVTTTPQSNCALSRKTTPCSVPSMAGRATSVPTRKKTKSSSLRTHYETFGDDRTGANTSP
jgi:hypothetical protein